MTWTDGPNTSPPNPLANKPGPLCGCGHTHLVGDDDGADAGCTILGHGCDCWEWQDDRTADLAPGAALDKSLRDLGEMLTLVRRAGFPVHRDDDECYCDTCWSYLAEEARS